jgi:AcrR family transcriptional regulator
MDRTGRQGRRKGRPARGAPEETRERLVRAAAEVFNRDGYQGTDSNALARAAGYAPGTFYKHFENKREIFLAAYQAWVDAEWAGLGQLLAEGGPQQKLARRLVALTLDLHRRSAVFRRSLRALVATDEAARDFYRGERRRQLELLREWSRRPGVQRRSAEEGMALLYTLERVCDSIADGEAESLGLREGPLTALLERQVAGWLPEKESC